MINWASSAQKDLLGILSYLISQEDQKTAEKVAKLIFKGTKLLSTFPLSGKPGKIIGTRELHLKNLPYFVVYKAEKDKQVSIIRVIHTSRLWDNILGG